MGNWNTRKATPQGKAQTLHRRQMRATKYATTTF